MSGYYWKNQTEISLIQAVEFHSPPYGKSKLVQHNFWALDALQTRGSLYRVGQTHGPWFSRPEGILHLYSPHTIYEEDTSNVKTPLHSAFVCFKNNDSQAFAQLLSHQGYARIEDDQKRVFNLIQECSKIGHLEGESGYFKAHAILCTIVNYLNHATWVDEKKMWVIQENIVVKKIDPLVENVLDYIENHLNEVIRLNVLANFAKVSLSTLTHRYQLLTGESPLQTQQKMRTEQAKQFLIMGAPMKEISARLGYSDVYHFSKTFKKSEGISPKNFRQNS